MIKREYTMWHKGIDRIAVKLNDNHGKERANIYDLGDSSFVQVISVAAADKVLCYDQEAKK